MHSQTNEQALESSIEKRLTGTTLEDIKEQSLTVDAVMDDGVFYQVGNGYFIGQPNHYNA